MAFLGERKDRVLRQATIVPVITPLLYGMSAAIAPLMAVALWLSAFDFIVRRGSALFLLGFIEVLFYGAVRVFFFFRLFLYPRPHRPAHGGTRDFSVMRQR